MKISLSWLKEHLEFNFSAEELAEKLGNLGFEVESIERKGPQFKGVFSAQILQIEKHPNADRLSVCQVTDGSENFTIVCGAKNIAVGQKVPLAKVGADLPGGMKISRSKIRGVESSGMICSGKELGLGSENGGILILDPQLDLGKDMSLALGEKTEILDVAVLPNRPDCLSHLGLARELSWSLNIPLKPFKISEPTSQRVPDWKISVASKEDCPVYVGRVFENLKVSPSPPWLVDRLGSVGIKSINNVVDVTNYILMDLGQPLHVFDADALEGTEIFVRRALAGESLVALDDKKYDLNSDILVIADKNSPQAIAGVMGGLSSAVLSKTKRVFLESASFNAALIRKTTQALRLKSESSYRFERGTDPELPEKASLKAAEMILSLAGGKASDAVSQKNIKQNPAIVISAAQINQMLGSDFKPADIKDVFSGLVRDGGSLKLKEGQEGFFSLTAPSYRLDIESRADLAEEAARILGYQKIPVHYPKISFAPPRKTESAALVDFLSQRLKETGFFEAYNYDFISLADFELSGAEMIKGVRLKNPLSEDMTILRPNLLTGLLRNAQYNFNHGNFSFRLFEKGTGFYDGRENQLLSGIATGKFPEIYWKQERAAENDFYGVLGALVDSFSGFDLDYSPLDLGLPQIQALFHPQKTVEFKSAGEIVGLCGLLHPRLASRWNISPQQREGVFIFEFNLSLLKKSPSPSSFKTLSEFPLAWRDISIVLAEEISYSSVLRAIEESKVPELKRVELVDIFSGENIEKGFKSLTLRMTFGLNDRTITDKEVENSIAKILESFKKIGAVLRS